MNVYGFYNGRLGLICFVLYLILLIRGRKTFTSSIQQSSNYWLVFICMAVYSVLGFLEYDTYSYYVLYEDMYSSGYKMHVESFYYWLIENLPHSFLLWRFVIWCSASLFLVITAKILKINSFIFAFFTSVLLLRNLSMTRESLGISLMLLSNVFLLMSVKKRRMSFIVLSIIGIVASVFLHKSMIIFVVFLFLSYLIPMNKRTVFISLVAFPFLYSLVLNMFNDFIPFQMMNKDQTTLVESYQGSEAEVKNLNGIIFGIFEKCTVLSLLAILTKKIVYDKIDVSKALFSMYKYAYIMVYVSFLFLGQEISHWISYRVLHVGFFAMAFCASICFDTQMSRQNRTALEKTVFLFLIIISLYNIVPFIIGYW